MNHNQIELGDRVIDAVSQYEGIVISITTWLNGCVRVGVQVTKGKGKDEEPKYLDSTQLLITKKQAYQKKLAKMAAEEGTLDNRSVPGGPARETSGFKQA